MFAGAAFFLFPLYLSQIGFDVLYIGSLLATYSLIAGIASIVSERKNYSMKKSAIGMIIFAVIPLFLINQMTIANAFFIMGLIAVGEGLLDNIFEKMLAVVTRNSKTVSTDMAVLHFPYRIAEFFILAGIGFFVAAYGFYAAFLGVAVILTIYAIFALRFLQSNSSNS